MVTIFLQASLCESSRQRRSLSPESNIHVLTAVWSLSSRSPITHTAAPWSLNGSNSVVDVGLTPNPSGNSNFNFFPVRIRIRIRSRLSASSVNISRGETQGSRASSPLTTTSASKAAHQIRMRVYALHVRLAGRQQKPYKGLFNQSNLPVHVFFYRSTLGVASRF